MSEKRYFLGIDLGTSAVKVALIDHRRQMLALQTVVYEIDQPKFGWREINPDIWFRCLMQGLEELFANYDPALVDAIGVTGQMHTVVLLDEQGDSVRPAIMWDDTRTRDLVDEMRPIIEKQQGCSYIAKNISTGSPATSLNWLRLNEAENFARIRKFLIAPDYLVYRLTGVYGTDYCNASTSCLYDTERRVWSPFMQGLLQLDASVYPEVRGSAVTAGLLLPQVAEQFHLRNDVEVLTGTGDNVASALSTGCLGQGYPVISLGTSGVLMMRADELASDAKGKDILFSHNGKKFYHLVQGALQSNGTAFEWWIRTILEIDDFSGVDQLLGEPFVRKNKLLFFPHLMGEKTIFSDPDIRGAFIGLSTQTTREDMIYAVLEGLSFGYRELAEAMRLNLAESTSVKIVGGGAQSTVWAQTLANVLGRNVEQMDNVGNPAFGIALLAAFHHGHAPSLKNIMSDNIKIKQVFEPEAAMVAFYDEKYRYYKRIYAALKSVFQ